MDYKRKERAEKDFILYDCLSDPLYLLFLDKWRVLWYGRESVDPKRVYYHIAIDNSLDIFEDEQSVSNTDLRTGMQRMSSSGSYFKKREILEKAQECLDLVTQTTTRTDSAMSRLLKIKNAIASMCKSSIEKRLGALNSSSVELMALTSFVTLFLTVLLMFSHSSVLLKVMTNVGFYVVTLYHKMHHPDEEHTSQASHNKKVTDDNNNVTLKTSTFNSSLLSANTTVSTTNKDKSTEEPNDTFSLFFTTVINLGVYSICTTAPLMTALLISLLDILECLCSDLPALRSSYRVNDAVGRTLNRLVSKRHVVELFIARAKEELLVFPLLEALLRSLVNPLMALRTCVILCALRLNSRRDTRIRETMSRCLGDMRALDISVLTLLVDVLEDIVL